MPRADPLLRGDVDLLQGLILLASFVLFIPVLLAALRVNFAGLGMTPLAFPASEAPYIIYGWLAAGILVLTYFLATDRSRIARAGLVLDEPVPQPWRAKAHGGVRWRATVNCRPMTP
jgi:hypothetical protein